ncbi:Uncharacterised protein [Amycolatopsis camponoti]|uniref:Inositolphosphotransferase Aur1/Ipt1 domain-containing protein n=1 Tax=Amycolatopsis camponoti TaxID=2606593 RepID=A0A6I8LKD6_9PSEU|nr:phosphatase PAP2 family protein [Amycolatopsis camponoti]VVJ16447.1 Uncharacterised protein [Amycolatopsis camponoti]
MNPPPDGLARTWARALFRGIGGRPAVLVELVFLLLWFLLFIRIDAAVGTDLAAADANALALRSAEHAVHIDIERSVNAWLTGNPVLAHAAVYLYRLYYVVVAGTLLWVFVRHAEVYRKVRRTMVAMTALVLPVYWAVPMAPPRTALPGAVDIVARYDILGQAGRESWTHPGHYTAMPSMHVGWSLWCAYAAWTALRGTHPRLALASWSFPLLMAADVLATGNHYVLDIAGSVALLAVSVVVASLWGRRDGSGKLPEWTWTTSVRGWSPGSDRRPRGGSRRFRASPDGSPPDGVSRSASCSRAAPRPSSCGAGGRTGRPRFSS